MSKIEVDEITQQSGTTVTVGGGSGKTAVVDATTVTLGRCGGTVALASGASQTGFGRTGEWFASQKMNLSPDMMTLAKGLTSGYIPMSAVMVGEKVASTFIEEGGEFYHGFTYSGHPVAAAVALENLNIIERENLITKVASDTIPYFASKIKALNDHPLVGEARSFGLLACVELVKDKSGPELFSNVGETGMICRDFCIQNGLMMRAVRDGMIMSPALTITKNEIDEIINKFEIALEQTMKKII